MPLWFDAFGEKASWKIPPKVVATFLSHKVHKLGVRRDGTHFRQGSVAELIRLLSLWATLSWPDRESAMRSSIQESLHLRFSLER